MPIGDFELYGAKRLVLWMDEKEKADSIQHNEVKLKRKLRMVFRKLPFRPTIRFLYVYIWQKGFLDGWPGFVFARLHGHHEFLSVAKAKEVAQSKNEPR